MNCPKCGNPYLFKKSYLRSGKKAGTLFAHRIKKQKGHVVILKSCKLLYEDKKIAAGIF